MTPRMGNQMPQFGSPSSYYQQQQSPDPIRPSSRDSNCSDTSMTDDSSFSTPAYLEPQAASRKRTHSPYGRGHFRPHSAANNLMAPPMTRTRSLPTHVPAIRSSPRSPATSPLRQASPSRSPAMPPRASPRSSFELPSSASFMDIVSIAEDAELDITPRPNNPAYQASQNQQLLSSSLSSYTPYSSTTYTPSFTRSNSFGRRRPTSPLSQSAYHPPPGTPSNTNANNDTFLPSGPTSPMTPPSLTRSSSSTSTRNYNEAYPGFLSATSSTPTTPTSFRSRSPSVSSLETIADTPDAEEAAIEAHEIARLKNAADAVDAAQQEEEEQGSKEKGRGGWWNVKDKGRKRWSVCGAERRGDFEMETIWED